MKSIGKYFMFLHSIFTNRETFKMYARQTVEECVIVGVQSLFIVVLVSIFMGAVMTIQIHYNLQSPFASDFLVGYGVRNMTIMEMSPTVMAIIFAGRVGTSIASQLGSMRISEQIDALEIMGINPASYLVLPKILAVIITYPLLVIISIFLTIYSGLVAAEFVVSIAPEDYTYGLRFKFNPCLVYFSICKSLIFAFLVSSISSYRGFCVAGGAVAVSKASTRAMTDSCIAILFADFILTNLFF